MSRIIVLPGGEWQLPLVKKIKEMGHEVIVVSPEKNAVCGTIADDFLQKDIFEIDAIENYAREKRVDAIMSDECDIAMPVVAKIGERLNLKSLSVAEAKLFTNKYYMREFSRKNGFDSPSYKLCRDVTEAKEFLYRFGEPIIIKPLDSNSSHGVFKIDNEMELESRFNECISFSRSEKAVLAEKYIYGTEFTVDGIKTPEKHYSLAISEKKHFQHNPNIACELLFSHENSDYDYEELKRVNDEFVMRSGLRFGLTHAEYKYENGRFYLIEIAARGGGNLISGCIVQHLSGIDPYKYLIQYSLGIKTDYTDTIIDIQDKNKVAVLRFFDVPGNGGRVKAIHGIDCLENEEDIKKWHLNFEIGDVIERAKNDSVRAGYYIACSEDRKKLDDIMKRVEEEFRIEIEG